MSELDPVEIEKIGLRMSREKDYKTTTYYGTRKDGSKYMIAQVGDAEKGGKKYYRYFYADVLQDGKISNQTVLFSNTNVAHFINERAFGRKTPDGYEEAIDNVLFSKENINDSISKGTFYIGQVRKVRSDNKFELVSNASEITKSEADQKALSYPTKQFMRDNGSSFVVQQMSKGQNANGIAVNCYHVFEVINENGRKVVKRNVVYSEQDLLKDNRKGMINDFLSRDRLDRKVGEAGGYIGYYDKDGIRTYNPNLVQYFKSTESVKVKPKAQEQKTPAEKELTPEQIQRKMQWVRDFIKDYEDSEKNTAYALRANCEDDNIKRVVNSIKSGKFIEDFDNNATNYKDNPEWFMGRLIPSMARLLKEADNLTIDGGMDYLEQFVSIPEVNKMLLQIRANEQSKQMHEEAEKNRRTGNLPKYRKTRADTDKQYAQTYLRSGNLTNGTVEQEINYRQGLLRRDKIKVSDERDLRNVSMTRKQQISLTRVLARQEGKIPSEAKWDDKIGWYCDTDVNSRQSNVVTEKIVASSEIEGSYITPSDISDSTVRFGTGRQDINDVTLEIRQAFQRTEPSQNQQR